MKRGDKALKSKEGVVIGLINGLVCPDFGKSIMAITGFTENGVTFTIKGKTATLKMGSKSNKMSMGSNNMLLLFVSVSEIFWTVITFSKTYLSVIEAPHFLCFA